MIKPIWIIFLCILTASCFGTDESVEGFWIDPQGRAIAEFTEKEMTITLLKKKGDQFYFAYEQVEATKVQLEGNSVLGFVLPELEINWDEQSLRMANFFDARHPITFKKAPKIKNSDLVGSWHFHEKTGSFETSIIYKQEKLSYDFERLEINHVNKSYSIECGSDVEVNIKSGFIFTEPDKETGENYMYYLKFYTDNVMYFVDSKGYQWSQEKKKKPVHVSIPTGYKESESWC